MPQEWTAIETAEFVLLAVGSVLLVGGVIRTTLLGRWGVLISLPVPPPSRFEGIDLAAAFVILFLLPQIVASAILGGPAPELAQPTSAPATPPLPRQEQIVAGFVGQLLAFGLIIALGVYRKAWGPQAWADSVRSLGRMTAQALLAYVCIWPICFGLLHLTVYAMQCVNPDFQPPEHQTIRILLSGEAGALAAGLTTISAVVLAPVNEEILFRGLVQPLLAVGTRSAWIAILVCGAAFACFHFPLVHTMPALFALGLLLGYLRARTGSLTLVILVHMVFNAKTLLWLALGAA